MDLSTSFCQALNSALLEYFAGFYSDAARIANEYVETTSDGTISRETMRALGSLVVDWDPIPTTDQLNSFLTEESNDLEHQYAR